MLLLFLQLLLLHSVSLTTFLLSSLYKKAGIGKRKKPEVKYVVAKKGVGKLNVVTLQLTEITRGHAVFLKLVSRKIQRKLPDQLV